MAKAFKPLTRSASLSYLLPEKVYCSPTPTREDLFASTDFGSFGAELSGHDKSEETSGGEVLRGWVGVIDTFWGSVEKGVRMSHGVEGRCGSC